MVWGQTGSQTFDHPPTRSPCHTARRKSDWPGGSAATEAGSVRQAATCCWSRLPRWQNPNAPRSTFRSIAKLEQKQANSITCPTSSSIKWIKWMNGVVKRTANARPRPHTRGAAIAAPILHTRRNPPKTGSIWQIRLIQTAPNGGKPLQIMAKSSASEQWEARARPTGLVSIGKPSQQRALLLADQC